jgi:hypothetical protein
LVVDGYGLVGGRWGLNREVSVVDGYRLVAGDWGSNREPFAENRTAKPLDHPLHYSTVISVFRFFPFLKGYVTGELPPTSKKKMRSEQSLLLSFRKN